MKCKEVKVTLMVPDRLILVYLIHFGCLEVIFDAKKDTKSKPPPKYDMRYTVALVM